MNEVDHSPTYESASVESAPTEEELSEKEVQVEEALVEDIPPVVEKKPVQKTRIPQEEDTPKPKVRSTIAQQQEAARKILNESAGIQNTEKPVFQKVVSKKDEVVSDPKPAPKSTNTGKRIPAIEFDEKVITFDTIMSGDVVDYKFNFVNAGNAPLSIESAKATCGCTQPSYPFIALNPGEKGYIGVRYNSVGKKGKQKPRITIMTNINDDPIHLFLDGFVMEKPKVEETEDKKAEPTAEKSGN